MKWLTRFESPKVHRGESVRPTKIYVSSHQMDKPYSQLMFSTGFTVIVTEALGSYRYLHAELASISVATLIYMDP